MSSTKSATGTWGVAHRGNPIGGVLVDFQINCEPMLYSETDALGTIVGQFVYDSHMTATLTAVVGSEAAISAGDSVSVNGSTLYVTSAQVIESNQAFCKIQVTAERYASCTAVEGTTGMSVSFGGGGGSGGVLTITGGSGISITGGKGLSSLTGGEGIHL